MENKKKSAVIVTFYPNDEHLKSMITTLKKQVDSIIIVNNTPSDNEGSHCLNNIYNINLGHNHGIATAQNVGLRKALELNCSTCLLLDQDSTIPDKLIPILDNDLTMLLKNNIKVACIGPRILDSIENKIEKSKDEIFKVMNCTQTKQIIASGSLINLACLSYIGYMEDELFIDAVDHEWCWRAYKNGFNIYISDNIAMSHIIGIDRGCFFGFNYIICSPIRHYYQFRNTFWLLPRKYVPLKWKVKKVIEVLVMPIVFLINGPQRKQRLKFMCKGIKDGLLGHK